MSKVEFVQDVYELKLDAVGYDNLPPPIIGLATGGILNIEVSNF